MSRAGCSARIASPKDDVTRAGIASRFRTKIDAAAKELLFFPSTDGAIILCPSAGALTWSFNVPCKTLAQIGVELPRDKGRYRTRLSDGGLVVMFNEPIK